jgi:hypothetical protein
MIAAIADGGTLSYQEQTVSLAALWPSTQCPAVTLDGRLTDQPLLKEDKPALTV